jgi:hypothetical protein
MTPELPQLSTGFYVAIGVLIVANLGVVISLITFIFNAGKFVATTNAGIEKAQSTANRAHARLTDHERIEHGQSL